MKHECLGRGDKLFEESGPVSNVFASVEEGKVSPDEAKRVAYEWMDRYDKFCKERPSSSPDYYAPYLPWGAADAEKIFSPEVIYRNTLIQFFRMQKSLDRKGVK